MLESDVDRHRTICPGGQYRPDGDYLWPPKEVVSPRYVNYPR